MVLRIINIGQGVVGLLIVVELGLTGYAIFIQRSQPSTDASFFFMLFNSIWSVLALFFLTIIPLVYSYAHHNIVAILVLASTALSWLAGSIAVAAILGPLSKSGKPMYSLAKPIVAFSFFIWAVFMLLASLEVLGLLKGAYRSDLLGGVEMGEMERQRAT
ncbi:hypothetical protein CDD81_6822 [Ophiocordyceps australis]|uniref:MARVEL domain-containing protein n=1 Tax=Ophiocordyceps australis TaxID=1399860 RepID=A0A2C5Y4R7_9HYPO|nr:hypothetical protein CDD81_6822 [Ophiocordyceps australis]